MRVMLPEMCVYTISAGIVSSLDGLDILSKHATSSIVMARQGCLGIIWVFCLVTCRNSINGLASPIPHVIAALRASWNFLGQICPFLPKPCVQGRRQSPTKRQVMDCGNEEPEVWLEEALWSGTKMDPMCAPAPIRPCMNRLGKNAEPTRYTMLSRTSIMYTRCPATECTPSTLAR
jgi:hypothetical protein